jgi:hypothetical protein
MPALCRWIRDPRLCAASGNQSGSYPPRARCGAPFSPIHRWLHCGLHRLDFVQALRQRPAWDIVVVPPMLGVSLLCLIGLLLGGRRLIGNMRQTGRN